jgi:hypothetical protein
MLVGIPYKVYPRNGEHAHLANQDQFPLKFIQVQRLFTIKHPVHFAYQPPASSTFLSEQTSHQQPANNTFLSKQTSTSHQPPTTSQTNRLKI